jgi:hypothetical protein
MKEARVRQAVADSIVAGLLMIGLLGCGLTHGQTPVQVMNRTATFNLTFASPGTPGTVAQAPALGLGAYESLSIFSTLQGATGGTLDVYLQYSPDGGTTWVDYAHFPQLVAGAGATSRVWNVAKDAPQPTLTSVGTGTSPALAANSILGGDWGDRLRVLAVAGGGTSAGATQTVLIVATP